MSVLLISPIDVARLAVFAAGSDALPPGLSANDLAKALHAANLSAWRDRYPDREAEIGGLPDDLISAVTLLIPDPDPMKIIRTARDLMSNIAFAPGDPLIAVLNSVMERAAALRQERQP
jgi:hypothetical protein